LSIIDVFPSLKEKSQTVEHVLNKKSFNIREVSVVVAGRRARKGRIAVGGRDRSPCRARPAVTSTAADTGEGFGSGSRARRDRSGGDGSFTRREFFGRYPDHGLGASGRVAAALVVALSVMRLCEFDRF
jgi:hypothetical protein